MKEKLLILDDESLILTSLEHLFEDDYEVFTTGDAGTALRLVVDNDIAYVGGSDPGHTGDVNVDVHSHDDAPTSALGLGGIGETLSNLLHH